MKSVWMHIIKIRYIILIILLIITANTTLAIFTLKSFEEFTTIELKHEGLLLSHALLAGITSISDINNTEELQERIDRFVAARDNDIEINIMLLKGKTSDIVASNIMENIEETSEEEHTNLIASLKHGKPVVFIGKENDDENDGDDEGAASDENLLNKVLHEEEEFDFNFNRFLSITVPIILDGKGVGSINAKLSLIPLDEKIEAINSGIIFATAFEIILVLAGIVFLIKLLVIENSKLMKEETIRVQSELKALQSQVNPHFLFNTLNSLSSLISDEPELAEDLTLEMADLYRKILGASLTGWWPVADEIELVRSYLNIESFRLKEKLRFSINVPTEAEVIMIPCLIIEPLVENSVKHGINQCIMGGEIDIDIILNNDLLIRVEDTLSVNDEFPISVSKGGEKTGIKNIAKRLNLIYGENAEFKFSYSQQNAGAVNTIRIKNIRDFNNAKI